MRFPAILAALGLHRPPLFPAIYCPLGTVGGNAPLSPAANLDATAWPILVPAGGGIQVCYTTSEGLRDTYLEKGFCGLPADFQKLFPDATCPPSANTIMVVVSHLLADLGWDWDGYDSGNISRLFSHDAFSDGMWEMMGVVAVMYYVGCLLIATLLIMFVMSYVLGAMVIAVEAYLEDCIDGNGPDNGRRAEESICDTWLKSLLQPNKAPGKHVTFDLKSNTAAEDYDSDGSDDSEGDMTPASDDETDEGGG